MLAVVLLVAGFLALQWQLRHLNARLDRLEANARSFAAPSAAVSIPPSMPGVVIWTNGTMITPRLPADADHQGAIWGRGEVNGWTYYLVPCAAKVE
jgi:hypothetical protein